ncbi:DUF222 domain-containing protein [Mycobacterium manitobense]|uniref:DUF222 domain-containing protein n=1 Tax=[Mycobacterium] manitobense TaxID=190147 RepID=A0A9X2YTK2_9MYCO|nr:HNH endonuclease signature motif containing protein [[Mycobacterium] manitobense]MCV7173051.1 DUF222 domain-containing protein [[Mycobacterium] manitobense]
MFEALPPEMDALPESADAAVCDAITGWARIDAAACARKHAAMAELFTRRTGCDTAQDRNTWWVDPDAAVGAEIGAAQNISSGLALFQTHRAVALRDRLPQVAALFADGQITELLVRTLVSRTNLITDPDVMAKVDTELAAQAHRFGPQSAKKTEAAIDAVVELHDTGAVRRIRTAMRRRDVITSTDGEEPGMASVCARLYAGDAAGLAHRLDEMARAVCDDDPPTLSERRADALGALGAGVSVLACACGETDCPATSDTPTPAPNTIVYVITNADESDGQAGADADETADTEAGEADGATYAECRPPHGETPDPGTASDDTDTDTDPAPEPAPAATPTRKSQCRRPMAFVLGAGILPTALLAETTGKARRRTVRHPGDAAPEPRYTPSRALADYIRCRDLTCRFPGCDQPADRADIDHTIPYPAGPTHASNLKCLCRFHHLLKTFWCGPSGWTDVQYPDGTIVWTAPTGHTYTTRPGSALIFPTLCRPTGNLPPPPPQALLDNAFRGVKMPTRRRTRAQNRAQRIAAERKLNDDHVAERNTPPPF